MSSLKPRQWRSLDELADSAEFRRFVENEFPASAGEMLTPASRRTFLKMMGASLALGGMTACRWPREEILPFADRPDGYTPGEARQFATSMELGGAALGLLVTSVDGRPIKIEGNPLHPSSLGGTSALAQAAVLEMYDPERSRRVIRREDGAHVESSWDAFEGFARESFERARSDSGARLAVLTEASSSPSLGDMRERLLRALPRARWFEYEAVSRDNERDGARLAYGRPLRPQVALDRARVIVSLDDDLLLQHPTAVRNARDFSASRDPHSGPISRLYVVESIYSLTGSMADHRLPVPAQMIPVVAGCLGARLLLEHGLRLPSGSEALGATLERFQAHPMYTQLDGEMARDLAEARGASLLVAGPRQPAVVHALVGVLNVALGNVGTTVELTPDAFEARPSHLDSIRELAARIGDGEVETLVMLGGNPVYDAPADLDFARLLGTVEHSVHLALHEDETSRASAWHLPRAHTLESWGDVRDWRGRYGVVQPLIEPLFGGKTPIELLALLTDDALRSGYEIVRRTFADTTRAADFEATWRRTLHDGLLAETESAPVEPTPRSAGWAADLQPYLETRARLDADELELVFVPDSSLHDGRFANNAWLQELPEALTKLTWDNAALVAPATAERLGLQQGGMVRVEHDGRALELPVYVMPGQAAGSIGVWLGYGRRDAGPVGSGVGFDAYTLRTTEAMHWATVRVAAAPGRHTLATTQNHYAMDPLGAHETAERAEDLAREMSLEQYVEQSHHPDEHHGPHEAPLWKRWEYAGHKWGMAIDLNACTGCNSCLIACQSENNIPVVGKDEVVNGRDMHWIRVDRYFAGEPDDPAVAHQPMTCHHCENAPCEQVCPVAATVHDREGLNVMVYNRCVGTRYCANNCPYKVRRFNYFNNHKNESDLEKMVYNPEVTVRSRGVMEKCSFCVQRIKGARIRAKIDGRELRDGDVTPACAQACPTRAIHFGDLNDETSDVRKRHEDLRAYGLLEELDVRPRTRYLTRLRNRHASGASESVE